MIIVCCGMPRSGSTLQFNIVWQVMESAGLGRRVDWRIGSAWERASEELAAMAREQQSHVIKIHAVPEALKAIADEAPHRIRFAYVHRDIRDVVVSLQSKFGYSVTKAIRRIGSSVELEEWLARRPPGHVLVQDYERLLTRLPEAVGEVARFFGAELSAPEIARIAAELDINKAYARSRARKVPFEGIRRRLNFLLGRKTAFADDELMLHPGHVSEHRGQIGIWRERLTGNDLAAVESMFEARIRHGFHV